MVHAMKPAGLPVHDPLGAHDSGAEGPADELVAQTYPEHRQATRKPRDQGGAAPHVPGRPRVSGAGREDNGSRWRRTKSIKVDTVVLRDLDLGPLHGEGLGEVEGEGVVVVDQQDPCPRHAGADSRNRVRVLLQRVTEARVQVAGETVGDIGPGLLLLVGIGPQDGEDELAWMANKCAALRVFSDAEGKMNASVVDVGGACLAVSQFTLYGSTQKGNRPSFVGAADPARAERLFDRFCALLSNHIPVQTGRFGADMQVKLTNDGPVTIWLERGA